MYHVFFYLKQLAVSLLNLSSLPLPPSYTRESTGSFSGYESESPLVSQFSVDTSNPSNTQAILNLNFALPKYIVMLDIWNSQVHVYGNVEWKWSDVLGMRLLLA